MESTTNSQVGEIHISQDRVDEVANIVSDAYEMLMAYFYHTSLELMEKETLEFFNEAEEDDRNSLIMEYLKIHFRKIGNSTLEISEPLSSLAMVSYFDDLDSYLGNNLSEPFTTYEKFMDCGLNSYIEDSISSLNMSTLDYFWTSRFKPFLESEKMIDASLLFTLDYAHIFFDVYCDKFNEILNLDNDEVFYEDNRMSLEERLNTFIEEELEKELVNIANTSIRDFCNIIIDPYSSIIMKIIRFMEEASYTHLENINENITKYILKKTDGVYKVNEGKLYNETYNDLMVWARSNQDLNVFSEKDIGLLNTKVDLEEMKAEAYDIADSHSQYHSGLPPEEDVVSIHARYLVIEKIYLEYYMHICDCIETLASEQIKSIYIKKEKDNDIDIDQQVSYEIDILRDELIKNAIIETSHIMWRELLPPDAEKIIID